MLWQKGREVLGLCVLSGEALDPAQVMGEETPKGILKDSKMLSPSPQCLFHLTDDR